MVLGCKTTNLLECFSPVNSKFSADYNVGGGVTEKEEAPHGPEVALTVPGKLKITLKELGNVFESLENHGFSVAFHGESIDLKVFEAFKFRLFEPL